MIYKEDLIECVKNNFELARDLVLESSAWDGGLEYLYAFNNDEEFFETFQLKGFDLACKVHYGNYNPSDQYVRFNGYENLESLDDWQYKNELYNYASEIVEETLKNYYDITIWDTDFDAKVKQYLKGNILKSS